MMSYIKRKDGATKAIVVPVILLVGNVVRFSGVSKFNYDVLTSNWKGYNSVVNKNLKVFNMLLINMLKNSA